MEGVGSLSDLPRALDYPAVIAGALDVKEVGQRGYRQPVLGSSFEVSPWPWPHCAAFSLTIDCDIPGTASNRFEAYGPAIIERLGIRAIVGKGAMGKETMKAMARFGCIHLTTNFKRGGRGGVKRMVDVYDFDELGTVEATWVFEVADWGPFVVGIDTKGRSLFDEVDRQAKERLAELVYPHFGIPKDFRYTMDLPG